MKNRQRGRNGGKPRPPGGGGRNPNFDGGNMRPRGNAQQLMEKFLALARDASSMGDRVAAENYYQHADHYYRVLNARYEQQQQQQQHQNQQHQYQNGQRRPDQGNRFDRGYGDEDQGQQFDRPQDQSRQGYERQGYERQDGYRQEQQPSGGYAQEGQGRGPEQTDQPQQQQPSYQPRPSYQQSIPIRSSADSDIGLPPQILGLDSGAATENGTQPNADVGGNDGPGEGRSPRRRRGRGQGPRPGNAETAARD